MAEIMISYSWAYRKETVDRLYSYLNDKGYEIWKDDEGGMQGHLVDDMATAIENAKIILVCITTPYFNSRNCKKELEYADELNKELIVVKLDDEVQITGHGAYSMILAKRLYIQSADEEDLFSQVEKRISYIVSGGKKTSTKPEIHQEVEKTDKNQEVAEDDYIELSRVSQHSQYNGIYRKIGTLNNAPKYEHVDGGLFLFKSTFNRNWHLSWELDSDFAVIWRSGKTSIYYEHGWMANGVAVTLYIQNTSKPVNTTVERIKVSGAIKYPMYNGTYNKRAEEFNGKVQFEHTDGGRYIFCSGNGNWHFSNEFDSPWAHYWKEGRSPIFHEGWNGDLLRVVKAS